MRVVAHAISGLAVMALLLGHGVFGSPAGLPLAMRVAAQQRPDRSTPPRLGPTPQLNLPAIAERRLSNGLPVWIVEAHEVPLVQVSLLVRTGGGDDPADQFGLASLTAAMLDEGAGTRSALDIADATEFLGATLGASASFDVSAVRLNVPVARLTAALPIMADVVLRPTFPSEDLDRLRQERLTALLQARDDAGSVASTAFARRLFGDAHRYGAGLTGTRVTLEGFTAADLRAFHAASYQASNALLIVAGDMTADAMLGLLETHFGNWSGTGAAPSRAPLAAAPQPAARQIHIVDMPGAAQSQIRIGWVGVPRSTPEYFTLQVLNTVLGGSFTSRLNQNLREEHGYSYGASSRFDMRLAAGPFLAGAGVQTDKTAEALREFFNELNAIGEPIPADELDKAKNYVALSFPSEFETIGDLASSLEQMAVYGLPGRYFADYIANIQAVTTTDVQRAASIYIQPERFIVVVAGDRAVIEPGIRTLGLGPVTVMSVAQAFGD